MAIIKPANLAPHALPRMKGVLLTKNTKSGWVVQQWPPKRGKPTNPNVIWTSTQFARVSRYAANATWQERATAEFLTRGSNFLPRDILVQLAMGKYYTVVAPDGTVLQQASHAPPALQPAPEPPVTQWQSNSLGASTLGSPSTSAFAFKGAAFIPLEELTINAVRMCMQVIGGATYKAIAVTVNGSNVIQTLVSGTARSFPASFNGVVTFDLQATFAVNVRAGILVGRTDLSDTYGMPIYSASSQAYFFPSTDLGGIRLAKKTPATGQTCDVSGAQFSQSLSVS